MKRLLVIVAIMMMLALVSGCAYYQKQVMPQKQYNATEMQKSGMNRGDYFVKKEYGFRLLTIPISVPEPNRMIDAVIAEHKAQGVTNVEVEFSEFNALLFGIPKMRVTGHVVK